MIGRIGDVECVVPVTQVLCPGTVNGRYDTRGPVNTTDYFAELAGSDIVSIGHIDIDDRWVLIPRNEFNSADIPKTCARRGAAVACNKIHPGSVAANDSCRQVDTAKLMGVLVREAKSRGAVVGKVFYNANASEGRLPAIAARATVTTTGDRRNNPIWCDLADSPISTIDKVHVADAVRNRSLWATNRGYKGIPTITAESASAIASNG